jgi:hypothetical protein
MANWARRLSELDRRWIFLLIGLSVILPMFFPIAIPEKITEQTQQLYDAMEALPEGSLIMIPFEIWPSTLPETRPLAQAAVRHAFMRNMKIIALSNIGAGGPSIAEGVLSEEGKAFGKTYGVDYVNLGYKANYLAVLTGMGTSIRSIYPTDFYGTPLDSLPIMRGVDSYRDIKFVFAISDNATIDYWVSIVGARFGAQMGAGVTAVMAPKLFAYVDAHQLVGLLGGMKGGAEYEHLIGRPDWATRGMGAQSLIHLIIIGFIVLGNVGYFMGRRKGATS